MHEARRIPSSEPRDAYGRGVSRALVSSNGRPTEAKRDGHAPVMSNPRSIRRFAVALLVALLAGLPALAQDEAWLDLPLTDAATGEVFALSDFDGSVVVVETMSTWCGNCRRQLTHLRDATAELAGAGVQVVVVAVSVERGLAPSALAAYAEREGFPFRFVVADDALLRALADRFGRVALNPPATPHVIVAADGTVGQLSTGTAAPAALIELLQAAAR
jgi:peroxiredoxin